MEVSRLRGVGQEVGLLLGIVVVERIDGDYLNVVGLPAALLVRLLAGRFAGLYGLG